MQLFSWLTKRMTGRPTKSAAPRRAGLPRVFRPQLELLAEEPLWH